jgi:hypothetical protein
MPVEKRSNAQPHREYIVRVHHGYAWKALLKVMENLNGWQREWLE